MADIRFEVRLNGEQVCVSGVAGKAVLSQTLSYVNHGADHDPDDRERDSTGGDPSIDDPDRPRIELDVGG